MEKRLKHQNFTKDNLNNQGKIFFKQIIEFHGRLNQNKLPKIKKNIQYLIKKNTNQLILIEGNIRTTVTSTKSIYITSCFPKEGKTFASIQCSYGLANFSNKKVLLIDFNLSNPSIYKYFDNVKKYMLSNTMNTDSSFILKSIIPTHHKNLFLFLINKSPQNCFTFNKDKLSAFLQYMYTYFDYIILDGESVFSSPSPINYIDIIDSSLIVVQCESTKWEVVQAVLEKINKINSNIAGVVLNKRKFYIPQFIYNLL